MDFSALRRDPETIMNALVATEDKQLITKKPLRMYTPTFYAERGLAEVGGDIHVVGFVTWVIDDAYDFTMVPASMNITPSLTNTVKGPEGEYFEFCFDAGSVVLPNLYLPKVDTMTYKIYTVIHSKAKVPWFATYDTFGETFVLSKEYAGVDLSRASDKLDVLCALQARSPEDNNVYYKNFVTDKGQLKTAPPVYIPINSLVHAANSTMSRIGGRNFVDGLTSALVHPEERVGDVERILRQ